MIDKKGSVRPARLADPLYRDIRAVLASARAGVYRAVNSAMVVAYWHVGRLILEYEQGGRRRATYGESLLKDLSERLTIDFGRGFDVTNLRKMRQFYRMFEIGRVVGGKSNAKKRDAMRLVSGRSPERILVHEQLSWSHYRLLMQVEDSRARAWYNGRSDRTTLVLASAGKADLGVVLRTAAREPRTHSCSQGSLIETCEHGSRSIYSRSLCP